MTNKTKKLHQRISLHTLQWSLLKTGVLCLLVFFTLGFANGQNNYAIKGIVQDENQNPVVGATIILKGETSVGTVADINGEFTLKLPSLPAVIMVSFIGMETKEIVVTNNAILKIVLQNTSVEIEETIVVGYGKQKKESIVGAIAQTSGEVLERAGGVSNVGVALTGNVPGVIVSTSTGMPGEEDPMIVIRGQSTWNSSEPLILVDGVERPMSSVDISSVQSISVLKDASATAVFGVRGANGVIIITTKRGHVGKASIRATVNTTMKVPSKLPNKFDSYHGLSIRNDAIVYELASSRESWNDYLPDAILDKYRNPANLTEAERYPNVDWVSEMFKDFAMSYNASINISGGTKKVKYFTSADFLSEGDLFKEYDNNRGYQPGYGFKRLNVRSNLDFELTPTTTLKANLFGSYGIKKKPYGASGSSYPYWIAAYGNSPDAFIPRYSDGTWGYYNPDEQAALNSVRILAISGIEYVTSTRLTTDFILEQDLSFLVKGLNFRGTLSLDNVFVESGRGVNDLYNDAATKWINPETGEEIFEETYDSNTKFDFQEDIDWSSANGNVENWSTLRNLFYQLQLNYATTLWKKHDFTAMGLLERSERATGSEIAHYREDWVFRATYDYDDKYMLDYSGAYNGSEKFSEENRFAFFSSGGVGYMLSKEGFMQSLSFIDMLKLRASYGEIGDDNISGRWLYMNQWAHSGQSRMGTTGVDPELSPYVWYTMSALGNENVHWEIVRKANIGLDYAFLEGIIAGSIDVFQDNRSDILISGNNRAVPEYFGASAPVANLGEVQVNGYEFELRFNKRFANRARFWADLNMTHATNVILEANDAELLPDYQKSEGKSIGQARSYLSNGYYNTWDEVYGSTMYNTDDAAKLPGGYQIIDYNGDGIIDSDDNIPFAFSSTPENTYNATLGFEYKGFRVFTQFYGVNNVTRQVVFSSLNGASHTVFDEGTYWSKDNPDGDVPMIRWLTTESGYSSGTRYMFDGSYVRLKNAEIAYTFTRNNSNWLKNVGVQSLRVYLNGNNIWVWTKMPDDRESNFAGTGWASQGAYPTVKRYNLGLNITF